MTQPEIPDDIKALANHIAQNYGDEILITECAHSIAVALSNLRNRTIAECAGIADQHKFWTGDYLAAAIRALLT